MHSEDEGRHLPLVSGLAVGSFQPSIRALDIASLTVGSDRKMRSMSSPQEMLRPTTEMFHTHIVNLPWDWEERQVTEIQVHAYTGVW